MEEKLEEMFLRDLKNIRGVRSAEIKRMGGRVYLLIQCSWLYLHIKWLARGLRTKLEDVFDRSPCMRELLESSDEVGIIPYSGSLP